MKLFNLFLVALLFGCGAPKEIAEDDIIEDESTELSEEGEHELSAFLYDTINVKIKILEYTPYCGGMAPTQEMLDNRVHPANGIYVLENLNTGKSERVKTDNFGVLHLNLTPGKYGIKELYKDVPFNEFYTTYLDTTNQFIMNKDKLCYEDWWSSYLSGFEIINPDTLIQLNATINNRCFTGKNPCQDYTGPYPP